MRFEVEVGKVDRFTFSVGPDVQRASMEIPWLYVMDVALQYDESSKAFSIGTVAVDAQPGILFPPNAALEFECVRHNGALVAELAKIPATRSDALTTGIQQYAEFLRPR
jgi:hypothetical protein